MHAVAIQSQLKGNNTSLANLTCNKKILFFKLSQASKPVLWKLPHHKVLLEVFQIGKLAVTVVHLTGVRHE